MSDTPSHEAGTSFFPKWIKCPQDFVGGLALMALALFALWASRDLQGMHGFSFGAGTAPRIFAVLLLGLGFGVMLVGILAGPAISLSRSVLCFARDPLVRLHDPPAGPRHLGLCELYDRRPRYGRDAMERGHHRRHLPHRRMQPAVSLCARAAVPALPAFHDPVRA